KEEVRAPKAMKKARTPRLRARACLRLPIGNYFLASAGMELRGLAVCDYFLLAAISARTSVLWTLGSTFSHTLTTLPDGEMRNVSRAANFMSPWVMRGTP